MASSLDICRPRANEPLPATSLTFFAMPKAFCGHVGCIQRNAIESWTRLQPRPQVLLFGDDDGVAETAGELGLQHTAAVGRNEYGTPLMDDMFRIAHQLATSRTLVYINSDIILLEDFSQAIARLDAAIPGPFLLIGRRTDVDVFDPLDFCCFDWPQRLSATVSRIGTLAPRVCKDYFVFRKPLFAEIPPFAIGRAAFDNWLVFHARQQGIPVIDGTRVIRAIHQNHDHRHVSGGRGHAYLKGEEAKRNCELAGGMRLIKGSTTTWVLTPRRLRRRLIPSDLLQFGFDMPRFLLLVGELFGWRDEFQDPR
ncbi:MAG: hypothetical protein GXX96_38215 [Planctomycetaceae bacterium]|nr:hypothetical protein [Planctomycetaceae bacterium]